MTIAWRRFSVEPSAVLLAVQLVGVLLYPFMSGPVGHAALSLFGLVVLLIAVRTVQSTPALSWVSILLGLPIVVLTLLEVADPANQVVLLWSSALHAAFYFYTSYALIRYMFMDHIITPDELYATGATFTVLAWAFAYTFMVVQVLWPGSFIGPVDPHLPRTWFELLFLSFSNLTSVGLSDILPVLAHARSIVMIEQVVGLMYVAIVISRIVGLAVRRQQAEAGTISRPGPQA